MKVEEILNMGFTLDVLRVIWNFSKICPINVQISIDTHADNAALLITGKDEKETSNVVYVDILPMSMVDNRCSGILYGWLDLVAHLWKGIHNSEGSFNSFIADKSREQSEFELMCINYNQGKAILA